MVREIESSRPRFIVVDTTWDDVVETERERLEQRRRRARRIHPRDYSSVFRAGALTVLARRERLRQ
jgi:hypothetical protein